jgi:hypothetical protein
MRTFYGESVAEEEDRRRRRGHGDSTEDGAVDVHSGPFRSSERTQLAAENGIGRWGHLSTQIERVTF